MPGWPFEGLLDNATMSSSRPTILAFGENGQEEGANHQELVFRAYLKRAEGAITDLGGGLDPESLGALEGFADRVLPDWALKQVEIACSSDDLGDGIFYPMPQIRPARGIVEAQTGSYLYGSFIANR
jgi:hypothetical protein